MVQRIGLLGFGRFGRALSWLLEDAGMTVRAFDPGVEVPSALRAASAEALLDDAGLVVLAVPVMAIRSALESIAPRLRADQLVIDVGSVKTGPEEALSEVLGARVPWVATHPLFGPASLARGDRPLRVVVCPNTLHPGAAQAARALYERIGCEVIEQSAEEHDRLMARTHMLTFFIAKGLLETVGTEAVPFAPPSFQALQRVLDAVRIDAGHLFYAIQHENPFAASERRKLIDALSNLDDQIAAARPVDVAGPKAAPLAIPDLGLPSADLSETRAQIDGLDRELVDLLRRRSQLARRAAKAKAAEGRAVFDPERERSLMAERAAWAGAVGLDPQGIQDVFDAVLRLSRNAQRR